MHDANARFDCGFGITGFEGLAVNFDAAAVSYVMAEENRDERAFASTILAKKSEDFTLPHMQRNVVISHQTTELFGDIF